VQVDAVEQGAGDATEVFLDLGRRAATRSARVGAIAAGTGIHGGDEDEVGGESRAAEGPADGHLAFLERLAQDLERLAIELGHLVEEEDALVGQADLARLGRAAAADQAGVADGVVRGAERPHGHQRLAGLQEAHHAVDARGLQALGGGQRRQDGRQSLCQQGFARAGRADHQYIMGTCGGDEQGPLGVVLALDVDEVFLHVGVLGEEIVEIDGRGVHVDLPGEEADGFGEAADRIDIQSLDDGGLGGVGCGHKQPIAGLGDGLESHRENSLDGPGLAGEGKLADDGVVAGPVKGHLTAGQQQPQRNRQIKTVGVLLEIGRSEVAKRTSSRACCAGFW